MPFSGIKRRCHASSPFIQHIVIIHISSRGSPLDKLLQISLCGYTQHKPPPTVGHDRKILLMSFQAHALEEGLELLQRCIHSDDPVHVPFPSELLHSLLYRVRVFYRSLGYELLQAGNIEVAQQGAGRFRYNSQVGIVTLVSVHQGGGDGGVRGG